MSTRRQVRRELLRKLAIEAAIQNPIKGRKFARLFRIDLEDRQERPGEAGARKFHTVGQ